MRNKNIARILRGDGGNSRSEQRRNAQMHILYYMFSIFAFYTNFRNGDARHKGPSLFPKTPENEENISQRHIAKWLLAIAPKNIHRHCQTGNKDTACAKQRRDHFAKTHCQSAACAKAAVKDNAKKWAPPEPDWRMNLRTCQAKYKFSFPRSESVVKISYLDCGIRDCILLAGIFFYPSFSGGIFYYPVANI